MLNNLKTLQRGILASVSALAHATALLCFVDLEAIPVFWHWHIQIPLLLLFSLAVSLYTCIFALPHRHALLFGIIRLAAIALVGYPLGDDVRIELILGLELMLESCIFIAFPGNACFAILSCASIAALQRPIIAWDRSSLPAPSTDRIALLGATLLIAGAVGCLIERMRGKLDAAESLNQQFDIALSRLSEANIGFQQYADTVKRASVMDERKRISREIHDAIGYTLTNIVVLSQQAIDIVGPEEGKLSVFLANIHQQSKDGLRDIRGSLRELRKMDEHKPKALNVVRRIIEIFKETTGIEVDFQPGNVTWNLDDCTNAFIYRMMQEGLTNSFRHGKSTRIRVAFWYEADVLSVSIWDNGSGCAEVVPGIGLSGMRERAEQLGGRVAAIGQVDGFKLTAYIPCESRE